MPFGLGLFDTEYNNYVTGSGKSRLLG